MYQVAQTMDGWEYTGEERIPLKGDYWDNGSRQVWGGARGTGREGLSGRLIVRKIPAQMAVTSYDHVVECVSKEVLLEDIADAFASPRYDY